MVNSRKFGPSGGLYAVTPSDAGDVGTPMGMPGMVYSEGTIKPFDALYVGVGGNISIHSHNDETVTLSSVSEGLLPIGGKRVNATSTTASSLVAVIDLPQ